MKKLIKLIQEETEYLNSPLSKLSLYLKTFPQRIARPQGPHNVFYQTFKEEMTLTLYKFFQRIKFSNLFPEATKIP
jgi:hypothetical protein